MTIVAAAAARNDFSAGKADRSADANCRVFLMSGSGRFDRFAFAASCSSPLPIFS